MKRKIYIEPDDPVIQRVRDARRQILKECSNDPHRMYLYFVKLQKQYEDRLVCWNKKKDRLIPVKTKRRNTRVKRPSGQRVETIGDRPPLSRSDASGYRPAVPALRASIARKLIRRRIASGLSQQELARRAGIRVETLNRLESGKHAPQRETIARIDKALSAFD